MAPAIQRPSSGGGSWEGWTVGAALGWGGRAGAECHWVEKTMTPISTAAPIRMPATSSGPPK
jgi:hypothetical protein